MSAHVLPGTYKATCKSPASNIHTVMHPCVSMVCQFCLITADLLIYCSVVGPRVGPACQLLAGSPIGWTWSSHSLTPCSGLKPWTTTAAAHSTAATPQQPPLQPQQTLHSWHPHQMVSAGRCLRTCSSASCAALMGLCC